MASDGRRLFVLGGKFSFGGKFSLRALMDEAEPIHILDTSMYFIFVISFGQLQV